MNELKNISNPYDFANPVADKNIFVGRQKEMDDIKYYLNHAFNAPRPINIAVLGDRASGKTSLLNMTEIEAEKKGLCTVRIDLDKGDTGQTINFFYKLFDSIITTVCERGAYGGINGKTYQTYLEVVNALEKPKDMRFCPFIFPIQYANAIKSGKLNMLVSDQVIKRDLERISSEIKCPIVLLFDEGNILSQSVIILEKIRNIFSSIKGYMLVLSGTHDLFPVIDEVFSPIVRGFKKIQVREFIDEQETRDCILKPLENAGIQSLDIMDIDTYLNTVDIHNLTSGRPYEIQLICHMMFKRVQNKRAEEMKLDLSIIEDVRKELETTQDITKRPVITKIKNLDKELLESIGLLCACDGVATFEQLSRVYEIYRANYKEKELKEAYKILVKNNILGVKDDCIYFNGDDFDKIYTKYFAREQGERIHFSKYSVEELWHHETTSILGSGAAFTVIPLDPKEMSYTNELDLRNIVKSLGDKDDESDIFVIIPDIVFSIYIMIEKYRKRKTVPVYRFVINNIDIKAKIWGYPNLSIRGFPNIKKRKEWVKKVTERVERARKRLRTKKHDVVIDKMTIKMPDLEVVREKVIRSKNKKMRERISDFHHMEMVTSHLASEKEDMIYHRRRISDVAVGSKRLYCNNNGYIFMSKGELDKAKEQFEMSIELSSNSVEKALPLYNLGILYAMKGDLLKSKEYLEETQKVTNEFGEYVLMCLYYAEEKKGKLSFSEQMENVSLIDLTEQSLACIEKFIN